VIAVSQDLSCVDRVAFDNLRLRIESRLADLKSEYGKGQLRLQQLQTELVDLQQVMLRLSGAITVLEEFLKPEIESGTEAT
jgi:hypothetical protein